MNNNKPFFEKLNKKNTVKLEKEFKLKLKKIMSVIILHKYSAGSLIYYIELVSVDSESLIGFLRESLKRFVSNVDAFFVLKKKKSIKVVLFLDNILGLPDRWLQELRNLILLQSSYDVCLELRSLVYLNKIVDIDRVCSMIFCFSATIYEYSYIKYNGSYSDLAEESLYQLSADLSFGEQEEILVLSENKRIPAVCIRNKLAINKPIILIKNLLNVYLKINKLIVYHDKLLKKVTGSTNSWAFFESFADLSANPIKIEDSLYCNLPFYFEQISISDILIENRDAFLEIAKIPSYYLSTEYLNCDNLEFKDGYFSRAGVFISKFQPQMVGVPEKKVPASFLYLNKFFDFNQNYEKEFTMAFEIQKNILK